MSHSAGEVYVDGRVVGHFEYNGTCDVAKTDIHPTRDEMNARWREPCTHECVCGRPPVDVILYTHYGNGFHWASQACLNCGVIVGNTMPFESVCVCTCKDEERSGYGFGSICCCGPTYQEGRP